MSTSLLLHGIVKTYADRVVLPGITATMSPGSRVGLIGENGSSKSTLLRIAAWLDDNYSGAIDRPGDLGYLARDIDLPRTRQSSRYCMTRSRRYTALAELERAAAALEGDGDGTNEPAAATYDALLAWAQARDAWDADRRANHLSLQLVEDLEDALAKTPATVIIATHDRRLRDHWPAATVKLSAIPARNRHCHHKTVSRTTSTSVGG